MHCHFLRFPGGKPKAVTLSYDDGVYSDIRMAEILNRYGIKCTFNINSAFIAEKTGGRRLTEDEIRQHLLDAGHEIAVHGHEHKPSGINRSVENIQDVLNCRLELEKRFGRIVRGMAYPDTGITLFQNGATYASVRQNLQALDIVYARTLGGENNRFALPQDWYAWTPNAHHSHPQVLDFAREFVALKNDEGYMPSRWPRLFYLWGHSYEFDDHNNWDHLENICRILSGREDVWYATNMEIWEYVHAYDSLVFSADSTRVYNPTLIPVWFMVDGVLYAVDPGQTIQICQ